MVVDPVGQCLVAFLKSPSLKSAKQETSTPHVHYQVYIEAISNSKMLLSFISIIIIHILLLLLYIIIIVPTEIEECQYVGWRCDEYKGFYDRNRWAPFNWSDRKTKNTCGYGDLKKVKTKSIRY